MAAKERIVSLLLELGEIVKAEKGGMLVISTIPKDEDKDHLIAGVRGNSKHLAAAVAELLERGSTQEGGNVLRQGFALAMLKASERAGKKKEKQSKITN